MRTLLHIAVIMALLLTAACGQFLGVGGDGSDTIEADKGRRMAGEGFLGGGVHSTSPNYTFDQRLNIDVTDGIQRGPHYEVKPGY